MAKYIGINKSLLAKYIYGIKKPSTKRMQEIKQTFHLMGQELIAILYYKNTSETNMLKLLVSLVLNGLDLMKPISIHPR